MCVKDTPCINGWFSIACTLLPSETTHRCWNAPQTNDFPSLLPKLPTFSVCPFFSEKDTGQAVQWGGKSTKKVSRDYPLKKKAPRGMLKGDVSVLGNYCGRRWRREQQRWRSPERMLASPMERKHREAQAQGRKEGRRRYTSIYPIPTCQPLLWVKDSWQHEVCLFIRPALSPVAFWSGFSYPSCMCYEGRIGPGLSSAFHNILVGKTKQTQYQ